MKKDIHPDYHEITIQMTDGTLFSGTGTHGNSNTPFLLSSSGDFSLGDKLVWDASAGTLSIDGTITLGSIIDTLGNYTSSLAAGSSSLAGRARLSETGLDIIQSDGTTRASFAALTTNLEN